MVIRSPTCRLVRLSTCLVRVATLPALQCRRYAERIKNGTQLDAPVPTHQQSCVESAKNDELKKFRPELLSKGMTVDQGMVALQIILERNK